jgi:integrase/recombinase XerD
MMPESSKNAIVRLSDCCQELRTINDVILHSDNNPNGDGCAPQSIVVNTISKQADTDEQLIALWLHGKSRHTQRYYKSDVEIFFEFTHKQLRQIILSDLQNFSDSLSLKNLTDGSKRRILSSIKSLMSFAHKLGYLPFDISKPLILPTPKDTLAERILSDEEIHSIIDAENNPRNKLMLKFLFITGIRVSELCSLRWKDCQSRSDGGQITVYGKGSKTRAILIPKCLWDELMIFKNGKSEESALFTGRKDSKQLHPTTILRIVKKAAQKAEIYKPVSPHWFRHAHASIASEKAPLHVIQQSLGHSSIQTTARYLHVKPNDCSSKYLKL